MALRRAVGSLAIRSQAYLRGAAPSPPTAPQPSFRRPIIIPYRPFAAPPHLVKKAPKDDDDAEPRINNDITAPFLRLVTDQGHSVVPRHEALQQAARMGMDLVEVHRKSDPPVCKIMDFHKEKYNKDAKEKERLKTKSAIVLRGGDNKEVRFKAKTEIKDLKVKADAITRLMERGYRVKCMAMPAGNEAEDLGGPLSRLLGLIQDVCIVESGPHLDSKHAYVIVRHAKFATKKGGKKASKAIEDAGKGTPRSTASESPATATDSGDVASEYGLEVDKTPTSLSREPSIQREGPDRGFRRELNSNHKSTQSMNAGGNRMNPGQGGPQSSPERGLGDRRSGNPHHTEKRDMAPELTNRYASRRPQTGGGDNQQGRLPPQGPGRNENEGRYNQRLSEQPNQPPLPRFNQGDRSPPPQDLRRYDRGSHMPPNNNNQRQFQQPKQRAEPAAGSSVGNHASAATRSLGVFSTRTPATPEVKKTDGAPADKPEATKSFGIFSSPKKGSGGKSS
ncbi:translation initiation factor IF3-1, mitochondrial-like [Lolium rigidum]|uniref:translation initiation factor IF3-1, mitochondrial-like n=1 Tax=Lolium rigidum TaxID=89674 RepID=UPI001F5D5D74|nr:translation initiation factor IF3-1, mitochondrial-like [Lolium rigidum]